MADLLIRNLDAQTRARLQRRADAAGRSLQAEVKRILQAACQLTRSEALRAADHFRQSLGRSFPDSTALIRADRDG